MKGILVHTYPDLPEVDLGGRESDALMVDAELRREERTLEERATGIEETLGCRTRVRIDLGESAACFLGAAQDGKAESCCRLPPHPPSPQDRSRVSKDPVTRAED